MLPKGSKYHYGILIGYFGVLSIYHNDTWTLWVKGDHLSYHDKHGVRPDLDSGSSNCPGPSLYPQIGGFVVPNKGHLGANRG